MSGTVYVIIVPSSRSPNVDITFLSHERSQRRCREMYAVKNKSNLVISVFLELVDKI